MIVSLNNFHKVYLFDWGMNPQSFSHYLSVCFCSGFLPSILIGCLFDYYWALIVLCIFWIWIFYYICYLKIFFPIYDLSFHSFTRVWFSNKIMSNISNIFMNHDYFLIWKFIKQSKIMQILSNVFFLEIS